MFAQRELLGGKIDFEWSGQECIGTMDGLKNYLYKCYFIILVIIHSIPFNYFFKLFFELLSLLLIPLLL